MKFKLDENLGSRTKDLFRLAGHDVETVLDERLTGADDEKIFLACCQENRCLITFDLDFANPIRFPTSQCAGIIIIRLPHNPSLRTLEILIRQALSALESNPFASDLWIVEPGRIRIHQKEQD